MLARVTYFLSGRPLITLLLGCRLQQAPRGCGKNHQWQNAKILFRSLSDGARTYGRGRQSESVKNIETERPCCQII